MSPAVLAAKGICEVRVIKEVEELSTELCAQSIAKGEVLRDREIPVVESRVAEHVATHLAEGARCRRSHNRTVDLVASGRREGRD